MKKYLRQRVDRLDVKGLVLASTVTIEMDLCSTQREYERAFASAWKQVPAGVLVYCWFREVSDDEFSAMAQGLLLMPKNVIGIYRELQPLAATA